MIPEILESLNYPVTTKEIASGIKHSHQEKPSPNVFTEKFFQKVTEQKLRSYKNSENNKMREYSILHFYEIGITFDTDVRVE